MSRLFKPMMLVVTAASCTVMAPVAKAGDRLARGQRLLLGEELRSNNQKYSFSIYKSAGDFNGRSRTFMGLSIKEEGVGTIWEVGPFFSDPDSEPYLVVQTNGDLCLYSQSARQKMTNEFSLHWHSAEVRDLTLTKRVIMQDDGNLCIYWEDNKPIWWSKKGLGEGSPTAVPKR